MEPNMEACELAAKDEQGSALEVVGITRSFGDYTAVDNVSFAVERGQIFGLLGSNGAGKSTLIKMLTTLLPVTRGDARADGFSIVKQPADVRGHIGYVPQLLSADGNLTAHENLLFSARLYGIARADRAPRISSALQLMAIEARSNQLVKTFSGGMIRRLEIAQAMLHRPSVLFLDEPTIGLDPLARHAIWDHLRTMRSDFKMSVLLTTHDMDEAAGLCDVLAMMKQGRLVAQGTAQSLCAKLAPGATLDDVFAHYCGSGSGSGSDPASPGGIADTTTSRGFARRVD